MAADSLGVVFFTGLTAGGLSCLAVQGGLLASSVASQAEEDITNELREKAQPQPSGRGPEYERAVQQLNQSGLSHKKRKKAVRHLKQQYPRMAAVAVEAEESKAKPHAARPIVLFLGAKLVAYTILGLLLGWLGSALQLTPYMRAIFQVAIGIFMLGTALRLLNVHPIFRYFAIEPPRFITRYIRRKAKTGGSQTVTPVFLGLLTVLIPCGVTQAMMALAIGTGSPVAGALIMFAFTVGTMPLFFSLAYLATRLGERLHAKFLKLVGAVVLILGLFSIEGGLNLAGSPVSFAAVKDALGAKSSQLSSSVETQPEQGSADAVTPVEGALTIGVNRTGYAPNIAQAKAGEPVKLALVTKDNEGCTRGFVIPSLGIQKTLPETGTTMVDLPPQKAGTLKYTCSMGMYRGEINFS